MSPKLRYKHIDVRYSLHLNGGGIVFSHEFVRLVRTRIGKVGHVCEYCCGPGYIGFHLLAEGLCDRLTLTDVNPRAVEAVKATIRDNHLEDRVAVYQSDALSGLPESEKWDLVVGNPPWVLAQGRDIKVFDPGGRVHREFFERARRHLNPGGSVLFIEGGEFTDPDDFRPMMEASGFEFVEPLPAPGFTQLFRDWDQYQGVNRLTVFGVRLALVLREAYLLWCRPADFRRSS